MISDYYEFVIIDRIPNRTFTLLDDVANALRQLAEAPPAQIVREAIERCIPKVQHQAYLGTISVFNDATEMSISQDM